jgi:hypothetical protein
MVHEIGASARIDDVFEINANEVLKIILSFET